MKTPKTYPPPGETKFTARLPYEDAERFAHQHYSNVLSVEACATESGPFHAIRCASGYVAMIGEVDGIPMILHKKDNGTRELEPLTPNVSSFTPETKKASRAAHSVSGETWIDVEADTLTEAERLHSVYASAPALHAALETLLLAVETCKPGGIVLEAAKQQARAALALPNP